MRLSDKELLRLLGGERPIAEVRSAAGMTGVEFDEWWRRTIEARAARLDGQRFAAVQSHVEIRRDGWGIPRIQAANDADLFFGFGYAMAQDRLFQLDFLRRRGLGRLAEILGRDGVPRDTIARTVGLHRIAAAEWERLTEDVQQILESFAQGINAFIEECADALPVEFDLLDYRPDPWRPIDSLAIENEFRWYLTGRFPVIVIPELAKRVLGEGRLYEECVLGEADDESILWPGEYPTGSAGMPLESIGEAVADPEASRGSNNWVISGRRSETGQPLLASDPHIAFEAVSCWYEAHLQGGSFNVAGMAYAGMPAVLIGRNDRVAWGITNNICSQRDLYQEKTDPDHPGCFLYEGRWERSREHDEIIDVRDESPRKLKIQVSRNGPVVNDILPAAHAESGPVTLKWLGAHHGGWLTALLAMGRAKDVAEFREAARPWHVPTFSLVFADTNGHIGFQVVGRIPIRATYQRGYRRGWDAVDQWQGLIPFDDMPGIADPERDWIATANNRVAPDDYPRPLFGCWCSGWRASRIRRMIESRELLSIGDMRAMQRDVKSPRAVHFVPPLLEVLRRALDEDGIRDGGEAVLVRDAVARLRSWDFQVRTDSVPAAIFNVFFTRWRHTVARERFAERESALIAEGIGGCAARLLLSDPAEWFASGNREEQIVNTFRSTVRHLAHEFGEDLKEWTWGRLHVLPLKHVLSSRGDLATLLDHGGDPVDGDVTTVGNTGCELDWSAGAGAGYRMVVDLSSSPPALLAIDAQSQSGHPGSPHYGDQLQDWIRGDYHAISLGDDPLPEGEGTTRILRPAASSNGGQRTTHSDC